MNRVLACVTALLCAPVFGGSLTPPVGPVAPTSKTLTEVEPRTPVNSTTAPGDADSVFRIAQPGSYYLTGNVTGVAGKSGIELGADNVTLDLNGFEVVGVAGALQGINTGSFPGFSGATIRNGTVRNWPTGGVIFPLSWASSQGCRFENVTSRDNVGNGFESRTGAVILACIAEGNTTGFESGDNALFSDCSAYANTGDGFSVGYGSSVTNCISRSNSGDGFSTGNGPVSFTGCTSSVNGGDGYETTASSLSGCAASFNTGFAFRLINDSTMTGCIVTSIAAGCVTAGNDCTIRHCNMSGGTVGIEVTGADNRVEGNNVADSTTGISVTVVGNLIISNSVSGGTTRYSIVAGNAAGPIVTAANVATNTIPTANFDY